MLDDISTILSPMRGERQSLLKKKWLNASREIIESFGERYSDSVDLALLIVVGDNLFLVIRGESEMLEYKMKVERQLAQSTMH